MQDAWKVSDLLICNFHVFERVVVARPTANGGWDGRFCLVAD